MVFHDPRNWALDIQIILDVIQSDGVIDGQHRPWSQVNTHSKVDLMFCNPDLLWQNEFPASRLGQGAFKHAFQAVYKVRTSFRDCVLLLRSLAC